MQRNLELAQFTPALGHLDPFNEEEVEILNNDYFVYRDDGDINERATCEHTLRRRPQHNHIGMGGNVNNYNHCNHGNVNNDDP